MNDHFRRTKREIGLDAAEQAAVRDEALGSVIQSDELERLRSVIRTLDDTDQDLIHLRYVADLSFSEMADLLGKREDAVKKSVYRLLARLKSQME